MSLVVDGLTAQERQLLQSYLVRSPQLAPGVRERLAASIALRLRPRVPGASDFSDDDLFLAAVARAIAVPATSLPKTPGTASLAELVRDVDQRLDALVRAGALDTAAANRLRDAMRRELEELPPSVPAAAPPAGAVPAAATREPGTPAPARRPPVTRGPSPVETLFSPEHAPSLLLYVGAFLVVVAALIFVSVSREQISDVARFALLILGALAFLAAGLLCHRIEPVREAGRTFLAIGALLVPVVFAAYYALVARVDPFSSPAMWTLGSLAAGALYAVLALRGYGRAYAYLFFAAAVSAAGGADAWLHLPGGWAFAPFAALTLLIQLAIDQRGTAALRPMVAPLDRINLGLAILAITVGILEALLSATFASGASIDRAALTGALSFATIYFGLRSGRGAGWERWLAAAAPSGAAISLVFVVGGRPQAYGFVAALVAIIYAVAGDLWRIGTPVPMAPWLVERARTIALAAMAVAMLPISAYWTAPLVGAIASLIVALLLASAAVARATRSDPPVSREDLGGYVLAAAAVLHLGVLYLGSGLGLIHAGRAPFTGLVDRELAIAFAPLAALAAIAAYAARWRAPSLVASTAVAALLSAGLVVVLGYEDPPLDAGLGALAAAVVAAGAVIARRPLGLWIAALFAGASSIALVRWLAPPLEWQPMAAALAALVLFVPAYLPRVRANEFARVTREIAIVTASLALLLGIDYVLARTSSRGAVVETAVWLATAPVFLVLGAVGAAEALHRRSDWGVLVSTTAFLAATLVVIARFEPVQVEAFSAPVAFYLALVALGVRRYGTPVTRAIVEKPAQVGAAIALMGPTYLAAWRGPEVGRVLLVLAEALIVLRFAAGRGLVELASTALAFAALVIWRAAVDPLTFESATGLFGALLVALALAAPRFVPWRIDLRLRELAELGGVLLVLVPPLARATAGGSDALDHGATVLAGGVVAVALAAWSGRRALLVGALGMLGMVGVLALRQPEKTEPYLAAAGVATLAIFLAVPGYIPRRLPMIELERAAEIVGVALVVAAPIARTFAPAGEANGARAIAESLALLAVGILAERRAVALAAASAVGACALWVIGDPAERELHGIATGAALIALSLATARFFPRRIDPRVLLAMEACGAVLFVAPTLVAGWAASFFPRTPMVFVEIFIVLGLGVVLHRRWLVAGALAATGLETVRGLIDAVDRVPNWALFGASGALLLAVGFVLLLKRDAWDRWSRRVFAWWTGL